MHVLQLRRARGLINQLNLAARKRHLQLCFIVEGFERVTIQVSRDDYGSEAIIKENSKDFEIAKFCSKTRT